MINTLYVRDITGNEFAISSDKGEKVYFEIKNEIERNGKVVVSFKGIDIITIVFLNFAVGLISRDFKNQTDLIEFEGLSENYKALVDMVIEHSRDYFENPEMYDMIIENMQENWI